MLDLLRLVAFHLGMNKPPARITATVTLEGPAEEVAADLARLKGCERSVLLRVYIPKKHYSLSDHYLPAIKGGQIQAALEKLQGMTNQTVIDTETDRRLEQLIREFGRLTS